METQPRPETEQRQPVYPTGQRLVCERCQSEIEITNASPSESPQQVFRCCGEPMKPISTTDTAIGEG